MNKWLSYIAAILIFVGFAVFVALRQSGSFNPSAIEAYRALILKGFINTIIVSLIALIGSVILGFVMFLLSSTNVRFLT